MKFSYSTQFDKERYEACVRELCGHVAWLGKMCGCSNRAIMRELHMGNASLKRVCSDTTPMWFM